jgi:glycosyltransferase involved in cell wall biosynthesis
MVNVVHITTIDLSVRFLLWNQLKFLREAGFNVSTICSNGRWVEEIRQNGFNVETIEMKRGISPGFDLITLWKLVKCFRKKKFDIVHTHTPKAGLLGQLAARMAGVPIIVNTLHGFYFHDRMAPVLRRFYITLEKIAARCSDVILSQSQEDIQTALKERICRSGKIKHLGNGIDLQRFNRANIDAQLINQKRRELGLPSDARVVGFVGRLVAEKGILELLQATRIVAQYIPAVRLLIVGPIDEGKSDALRPVITRDYDVSDLCVFTGLRQDMPELYALMDVFVLPSHREGFPRSPMEASAMGIPCVVTNIRGCRESVEQGCNGILVPLGNVRSLADAIIELLTDHGKARKMGEEGRRISQERFDEQIVFEKVKTEYKRLLYEKGIFFQ